MVHFLGLYYNEYIVYIKVKVNAGAKKEEIVRKSGISFQVSVKEKPLRNLANRRVVELLAKQFHLPPNKVRIVSGHHSGSKILSVDIEE